MTTSASHARDAAVRRISRLAGAGGYHDVILFEVLIVRFTVNGQSWELRYQNLVFGLGLVGTVDLCGPPGCESGVGFKFNSLGVQIPGFTFPPGGTSTHNHHDGYHQHNGTAKHFYFYDYNDIPRLLQPRPHRRLQPSWVRPLRQHGTTRPALPDRCAELRRQYEAATINFVETQLANALRTAGCPVP